MRITWLSRCLLALFAAGSCPEPAASTQSLHLDADQIMAEAIARARQSDQILREKWSDLRFRFRTITETLNGDGAVVERNERVAEIYSIDGVSFSRLVEIDGRPLTVSEREQEEEREQQFRLEVEKKRQKRRDLQHDDDHVLLDEKLADKYRFHRDGDQELDGGPSYVLSFEPKSGKLPANNRIETVLNKTAGKIWIDQRTLEIRKIEFSLREKVDFVLGMVGSLSALQGVFEREPMKQEGLWVPRRLELYTDGRLMFDSLHKNQLMQWSDYQVVSGERVPGRP